MTTPLEELFLIVADGGKLNALQREELRLETRVLSEVSNFVKSITGTDNKILSRFLNLPFEAFYSRVLAEDTGSILVSVPSTYTHLIWWGAGRNSNSGTNSDYMTHVYNGDTGNNYTDQKMFAVDTAITGQRETSQPNGNSGLLAQNGRPAGDVCSFITFVPNYSSNTLKKNSFTLAVLPYGSLFLFTSTWSGIAPITSIELDCNTAAENIKAGSAFSFYGWK